MRCRSNRSSNFSRIILARAFHNSFSFSSDVTGPTLILGNPVSNVSGNRLRLLLGRTIGAFFGLLAARVVLGLERATLLIPCLRSRKAANLALGLSSESWKLPTNEIGHMRGREVPIMLLDRARIPVAEC
jgi:hypothetical protein